MPSSIAASTKTADGYRSSQAKSVDWSRRKRSPIFPSSASNRESVDSAASGRRRATPSVVSSPKSPSLRHEGLVNRLRSNSGLSLHTNNAALRQYTDYNADGSMRLSQFDPVEWREAAVPPPPGYRGSMGFHKNASASRLGIPDFFGRDMADAVLADPTTSRRLLQFAQTRGGVENIEFLMKVLLFPVHVYHPIANQYRSKNTLVPSTRWSRPWLPYPRPSPPSRPAPP